MSAVNLSPLQVRDRAFVDVVAAVLAESEFEPSRLVLEITEGVLIDDPDEAQARLLELRALGVRLALDDFGSGYSSLSYLQRLPFDKLKIDRSFVAALDQSANGGVIIQAIVDARPRARHGRGDRGRRDRGAARAAAACRLQRDAGLSVRAGRRRAQDIDRLLAERSPLGAPAAQRSPRDGPAA